MRVGIIQSNYVPWRGYFDFIDDVDLFVFYDDVQYTKGDWRNRNRVKTRGGLAWITVPVVRETLSQRICDTPVFYGEDWQERHLNMLRENYRQAACLDLCLGLLGECFPHRDPTISSLNVRLIRRICSFLGISTPLASSQDFPVGGARTDRLVRLLRAAGATAYLSGPSAKGYLEEDRFRESGIRLEYKSYDYPPYPQLWGEFAGGVSVLDLIANTGETAREYLKSRTPNEVAVP